MISASYSLMIHSSFIHDSFIHHSYMLPGSFASWHHQPSNHPPVPPFAPGLNFRNMRGSGSSPCPEGLNCNSDSALDIWAKSYTQVPKGMPGRVANAYFFQHQQIQFRIEGNFWQNLNLLGAWHKREVHCIALSSSKFLRCFGAEKIENHQSHRPCLYKRRVTVHLAPRQGIAI